MKQLDEYNNYSRVEKHRKRRNLNRTILILVVVGLIFMIALFIIIVTKDKKKVVETDEQQNEINEISEENDNINPPLEIDINPNENIETDENIIDTDNIFIDYVEPSDDNVIEAYIGNWQPVGTEQVGVHTTDFTDGSLDRIEIKQAVSDVTYIAESDMIEWRVENGGEQKVIATVSNHDETDIYRIYLSWIDEAGWQVTKVEKLKENDKK